MSFSLRTAYIGFKKKQNTQTNNKKSLVDRDLIQDLV